jgi:hypothetical protein
MGISITKDIEAIKKQLHENAQVFPKCHTYCFLVKGWGILQTEWHDNLDERPLIGNE